MATQVKVTLKALPDGTEPFERILTLTPTIRTIQVGRASKTASKGLQAAGDNAWFDSPVMSRNHAEISFDVENQAVTIRDIGSMHGTFVDGHQLSPHQPRELYNDDMVVFGTEVKRNTDSFPAYAFDINYEFFPYKPSSSYAFPETDEEDDQVSVDEDMEDHPSGNGTSIEKPLVRASEVNDAILISDDESLIDMTRDDASVTSDIECTGETSVEKDVMGVMSGRPENIDKTAHPISVALYSGVPPDLRSTDDEDSNFASNFDEQSEIEYDNGTSAPESVVEQDSEDDGDSVPELSEEIDTAFDPKSFPDKESQAASSIANIGVNFARTLSHAAAESHNQLDVDATILVEGGDDDNESDFGLSDAGAEGIRALFDDGLVNDLEDEEEDSDPDSVFAQESLLDAFIVDEPVETPKRVTFACLHSDPSPELSTGYTDIDESAQSSFEKSSLSQAVPNARQPSPSDAAMVKMANVSTPSLPKYTIPVKLNDVRSEIEETQPTQVPWAQSLADKTGKHAFFAAREENRAKIYAKPSFGQPTPLETRKRDAVFTERRRNHQAHLSQKQKLDEPGELLPMTSRLSGPDIRAANKTLHYFSPYSGSSYLHDHSQAPKVLERSSPEPYMTSANSYNNRAASVNKESSQQYCNSLGRSGLSINDILDGSPADHTSKTLKRKSDEMSDAIENEIRVWASSSSDLDAPKKPSATRIPASQDAIREEQSDIVPTHSTELPQQRPVKRLRKIAESVGYVALGGATLFGALVLSAPDFL